MSINLLKLMPLGLIEDVVRHQDVYPTTKITIASIDSRIRYVILDVIRRTKVFDERFTFQSLDADPETGELKLVTNRQKLLSGSDVGLINRYPQIMNLYIKYGKDIGYWTLIAHLYKRYIEIRDILDSPFDANKAMLLPKIYIGQIYVGNDEGFNQLAKTIWDINLERLEYLPDNWLDQVEELYNNDFTAKVYESHYKYYTDKIHIDLTWLYNSYDNNYQNYEDCVSANDILSKRCTRSMYIPAVNRINDIFGKSISAINSNASELYDDLEEIINDNIVMLIESFQSTYDAAQIRQRIDTEKKEQIKDHWINKLRNNPNIPNDQIPPAYRIYKPNKILKFKIIR